MGEREGGEALPRFDRPWRQDEPLSGFQAAEAAGFDNLENRQNRLAHAGTVFASEKSFSGAKIVSLQFPRPKSTGFQRKL